MKLGKFIASALALMLAAGTITALPADYAEEIGISITAEAASNDFVIKTDEEGYKYITSYKGKGGDITIPEGVYIEENAFKGNKKITSVTISTSCVIYDSAFEDCINLEKVVFKDEVVLWPSAFKNCINLKTVEFKNGVNGAIAAYAFQYCTSLEKVTINKGTSEFYIGYSAFSNCHSLTSINIPSTCNIIYERAFMNCFNLTKITIPSNTKFSYENGGDYHMGYFDAAKSEDDAWDGKWYNAVADGKTSVYCDTLSTKGSGVAMKNGLLLNYKKFTPKKLTMTVTKGSDAEKYAKKNGIAYKYASSSKTSDKLAAPTGFKVSKSATAIILKWDAVEGADAYRVYMYNDKTGKYEKCKTLTGIKCTIRKLEKGTKYKFKIVALDSVNGKYKAGETSKTISVTTKSE